jgi:alpha-glucosidase
MSEWWRNAVVYEIYVRSFADSNGDGIGDLPGIRAHLPYLRDLGVDGIWLTPFFPSPGADHGYDVADYVDVDPQFGTLADLDALIADAHELGLRVTIDVVPNHTSSEHPWFRNALADPSHPDRARYVFRPGRDGEPPNNWDSVFGGPAWTLDEATGDYYLHLFAPEQPDLDWHNPHVQADFEGILRFWLDRGVDGFRIDVAHGLFKDRLLRDEPEGAGPPRPGETAGFDRQHAIDQPEVHALYRRWRELTDGYGDERVLVGEVVLRDQARVARYVRPDELQLAFNFRLLWEPWEAEPLRAAIDGTLAALEPVGATPTWVLENHDVMRLPLRQPRRGPGGGAAPARAPGHDLPLRRAGARARGGRAAGRAAPGPDLLPQRRRAKGAGRLPGSGAVAERASGLRLHRRAAVAADPGVVGRSERREAGAGRRVHACPLS